jgi:hypothetical protein
MPKVYIPNTGAKHDFTGAEKYGDLVIVSDGYLGPFKTGYMMRLWDKALKYSTPDDYILICSLPVLCSIGAAMFAAKHKRVNFLQYRMHLDKYIACSHLIQGDEYLKEGDK